MFYFYGSKIFAVLLNQVLKKSVLHLIWKRFSTWKSKLKFRLKPAAPGILRPLCSVYMSALWKRNNFFSIVSGCWRTNQDVVHDHLQLLAPVCPPVPESLLVSSLITVLECRSQLLLQSFGKVHSLRHPLYGVFSIVPWETILFFICHIVQLFRLV